MIELVALLAVTLVGCASVASSGPTPLQPGSVVRLQRLHSHAAFDLDCPAAETTVIPIEQEDGIVFVGGGSGCGRRRAYYWDWYNSLWLTESPAASGVRQVGRATVPE